MTQSEEYRNRWALTQSALKQCRYKSSRKWKSIWIDGQQDEDKNEDVYTFGSLVDIKLFSPKEVEDKFFIGEEKLPSDAIASIIKDLYEYIHNYNKQNRLLQDTNPFPEPIPDLPYNLDYCKDLIIKFANEYINDKGGRGWNNSWKDETRIAKISTEGEEYFNSLIEAKGRKVISQEMNMSANEMCDSLLNDENVNMYFISNEKNICLFQVEMFVDEYLPEFDKHIPLKGCIDILRIDLENKTVQIADFKTTKDATNFISSIKKFGYAFQLSFYKYLLTKWLEMYENGKYKDFKILPPINIVKDKIEDALIYQYRETDLHLERWGNLPFLEDMWEGVKNFKIKTGWQQILEEIAWHYFNDKWKKPKEMYENGKIIVNLLNS